MAGFPAERPAGAPAFERLYRRHVREVYRYAVAMSANPADAEDVVQTTFLNAFRAYEQGQRPQRPQRWLMTIAHNVCRQRFRQQSSRPSEVALEENVAAYSAEEDAIRAEDIRRALSQIGFNQRAALVMRELEGRSYAEIGERLELTQSAVETLVFRARRALREQLEGTLTCAEAGHAISRQLDGRLARHEHSALRAHLRCCSECSSLARRMRGQRAAIKALGVLPLPASLASFPAGAGTVAGVGLRALALKLAGAATAAIVAAGAGYEAAHTRSPTTPSRHTTSTVARPAAARPRPVVAVTHTTPASAPARSHRLLHAAPATHEQAAATVATVPDVQPPTPTRPAHASRAPARAHGQAPPAHGRPADAGNPSEGRASPPPSHATGPPPAAADHRAADPTLPSLPMPPVPVAANAEIPPAAASAAPGLP